MGTRTGRFCTRACALAILFATSTGIILADKIILKRDNRTLEGVITQETDSAVTLQSSTSIFQINKSDIREIIRSEAASEEERVGDALAREGQWREALAKYEEASAKASSEALTEKIETARGHVQKLVEGENARLLKGVRAAQAAGQYDVAVKQLKALLTNMPEGDMRRQLIRELAIAHHQNAAKLADAIRLDLARQELEAAIKTDPQFRLPYFDLAEMFRTEKGRAKEAKDLYAKGFSLNTTALPVEKECTYRFHWAELLYASGEYEKALENFNIVVSKCPRQFPNLMTYVVDVNIKLGEKMKGRDVEESIRALKAAIAQDPSSLKARFLLAQIYYDNRQYDQTIEVLTELLAYDQKFPKANYYLAHAYFNKGDLEKFRMHLTNEIAVNPSFYEAYCELGEHLLDGAKNEEALAVFDQAIRVNDVPGRAHYGRATALRKLKLLTEAELEARTIVDKDPANPEGLTTLGQVLAAQSKLPEADEILLRAIAIFTEKGDDLSEREKKLLAETYFQLGEVALKNKSSNKAYENFEKSVELNPRNPAAYHGMATALVDARRLPEAEDAYIQAIEQKPDEAEYYLGLGILYHTHYSRPAEALPFYLKYVELGGEDLANVERWIVQCGGKLGDKAEIDVASLAENVRKRRAREAAAAASMPATSQAVTTDTLAQPTPVPEAATPAPTPTPAP